jgi:hypothetical protein
VRGDVRARAQVIRDPFFLVVVIINVQRRRIGHVSLPPSASARIACVSAFVVLMGCRLAVEWGAEERKTIRPVPFRVRYSLRARPPSRGDAAKKARSCTIIQDADGYHTEPQSAVYPESESSVRGSAGGFPARGSRPKVDSGKKCRVRTAEDREDVSSLWGGYLR